MKYISTRGGVTPVPFGKVVLDGYADDGGLYVPENYPKFDLADLRRCATYAELAFRIFRPFITEVELSDVQLKQLVEDCYAEFPSDPVPVKKLHDDTYAVELFHGPTFCFKDLGQQVLCRFIAHFVERPTVLIASTTGDTGPAAVHAVESLNSPMLRLLVAHPFDQISSLQRRQMTTIKSDRVQTVTFHGGGDDMDQPIKTLRSDKELAKTHPTCGINSYNFGRVLAQSVHYFWTYFKMTESNKEHVTFALPIGAMGNIAAGMLSRKCGLPIEKFIGSVNVNDITHRVFSTGVFAIEPDMIKNLSEAINIQAPYNFERVLYWATDENASMVKELYEQFEASGRMEMPADVHKTLQRLCTTYRVEDDQMLQVIRTYAAHDYLLDPHSAVAYYGASQTTKTGKMGVLCTAHWCKFEDAMQVAFDGKFTQEYPEKIKQLMRAEEQPYAGNFTADKDWQAELYKLIKA